MKSARHLRRLFIMLALSFALVACDVKTTYLPRYDRSQPEEIEGDIDIGGGGVYVRLVPMERTFTIGCIGSRLIVPKRPAILPTRIEKPYPLYCAEEERSVAPGDSTFLEFADVDPLYRQRTRAEQLEGKGYPEHFDVVLQVRKDGRWTPTTLHYEKQTKRNVRFPYSKG